MSTHSVHSSVKASSLKILLVGPSNAGKTSIAKRFTTDTFDEFQDMTIGSAFFSKQVYSKHVNAPVRVEVWDTAGQEKYRAMASIYFRNASGALLVYDQTSPDSFKECESVWLPELLPHLKNSTDFIVMCGNKCDLVQQQQRVGGKKGSSNSADTAHDMFLTQVEATCASRGIKFFQTSAKTGENVGAVFSHLVDAIMEERAQHPDTPTSAKPGSGSPVDFDERGRKKKDACCGK